MDTNSLIIWFKSIRNAFVGSDNPNYFALGTSESKSTNLMDNSDKNNNIETSSDVNMHDVTLEFKDSLLTLRDDAHQPPDIENIDHVVQLNTTSEVTKTANLLSAESTLEAKLPINQTTGQVVGICTLTSAPCCDIMKFKNELCHDLRSSPVNSQIKFGQKVAASKIIQVIIDAIKSRQLLSSLEPFISNTSQNFPISSLVTICMRNCSITGFSNVEKAETDGYIRCLDNHRFTIDFVIQLVDLRCEANYCIKLGPKWHKRICLRNKKFTLKLDRVLIYVELKINTQTKSIRVERFSPISQQNVRCKSNPFKVDSIDQKFCKLLQGYFKRLFAVNVLKLESQARRYLDRTSLLKYDDIFGDTGLQKMLECFASTSSDLSSVTPSDTSNS